MKFWICLLPAMLLLFSANAQEPAAGTNLWQFKLPDHGTECSPALAPDGTIYLGTFDGWMLAVTPDGKGKWKFKAGREIKSSPAVAADGTIYFGSRDWKFYALTPNGKLKWTFATGAWVDSSPAIAADGTVYFGSWDNNFYALNPDGSLKWKFATSNIISSSPAIAPDGTIYFGSHDKNLYALAPDGKLKWKFTTGAEITASPTIGADGTIYFTSTDGNCYAFKPDGTQQWKLHTDGYTSSSPVLDAEGNLYFAVNAAQFSLSSEGKLRWRFGVGTPVNASAIVTAQNEIFMSTPWREANMITPTAKTLWRFHMDSNLASSPNLSPQGVLYLNTGLRILAIRPVADTAPPAKSPWPMWRANSQHTGRVGK